MRRVCLLTGASGVLGNAFCRLYRDRYDIVAIYHEQRPTVVSQLERRVDPLAPAQSLAENEHPVFAVQADLLDDRALGHIVDLALARFDRIDLLINAAADLRFLGPLLDLDRYAAQATHQMALNALVPIKLAGLVTQRFWQGRTDNRELRRNVVNISSSSGLHVYPNEWQGLYSASKAALNYLTCHLAHDLQPLGVRVNALCPTAFPRLTPTERVARAIIALDEGELTGKVIELGPSTAVPRIALRPLASLGN